MTRMAIPFEATSQTVARNLTRLRKARRLSTRALSAELKKLGRPISSDAICKMENVDRPGAQHTRRVDVDDLVALAIALGVSPSALLLPLVDDPSESVDVTGVGRVAADVAWDWMDGKRPLQASPGYDVAMSNERIEYALHSRPPVRRNREITA